jgi:hypothetical protein
LIRFLKVKIFDRTAATPKNEPEKIINPGSPSEGGINTANRDVPGSITAMEYLKG